MSESQYHKDFLDIMNIIHQIINGNKDFSLEELKEPFSKYMKNYPNRIREPEIYISIINSSEVSEALGNIKSLLLYKSTMSSHNISSNQKSFFEQKHEFFGNKTIGRAISSLPASSADSILKLLREQERKQEAANKKNDKYNRIILITAILSVVIPFIIYLLERLS